MRRRDRTLAWKAQKYHGRHIYHMKIVWMMFSIMIFSAVILGTLVLSEKYDITGKRAQREAAYIRYGIELEDQGMHDNPKNNTLKSLPVLLYHGFPREAEQEAIPIEIFKEQMLALKRAGYHTITLAEAEQFLHGNLTLPEKSFLLTFDDGAVSTFQKADPIMKVLGYTGVIFVISKYSYIQKGSVYYLSPKELDLMMESGRWEVQAHARDAHDPIIISSSGEPDRFISQKMWVESEKRMETDAEFADRIDGEFSATKHDLMQGTKKEIYAFAFPYGDFGQHVSNYNGSEEAVLDIAKRHYRLVFYQHAAFKPFFTNYPEEDTFLVKRILVKNTWKGTDLVGFIDTATDKELPYIDDFEKDKGWLVISGEASFSDDTGMHAESPIVNATTIVLDGSFLWENFTFLLNVTSFNGTSLSLLAYYKNDDNYVSCDFDNDTLFARSVVGGIEKIIRIKTSYTDFHGEIYGLMVKDKKIYCIGNSTILIEAPLSDAREKGGVAIKMWSKTGNPVLFARKVQAWSME